MDTISAYKAKARILEKYLPKLEAFMDKRLTAENAERIYGFLQPYRYDEGGWLLYENAKRELDERHEFPIEDSYFETLDGYGLLKWLEIAKFAEYGYNQMSNGYEKLKTQTFDNGTPEYKEYQKTLWPAAIRSIIGRLTDTQPYLIPEFWQRLSYIENILGKGFPTRDDLIEKIDAEFNKDITTMAARSVLYNTPMTDEMIQALYIIDNVLDDICVTYEDATEEMGDDIDLYDVVSDFLKKAEHEYLAFRVFDRVKLEYEGYIDEVKKMPPEKIIDEAYKITILHDLHISLEPETSNFSTERLKALRSIADPLWSLYHEWQRRDWTLMDDIKDVIWDVADKQAVKNGEKVIESENGFEQEDNSFGLDEQDDGQEP